MMPLAAWTPFVTGFFPELCEAEIMRQMALTGWTRDRVLEADAEKRRADVFINSRYQVLRTPVLASANFPELIHLKIVRLDREAVGPERYRDFMRIKDELVGSEHEAVELYPPRSTEVDTINMYHLWVFASDRCRLPLGFRYGREVSLPRPAAQELKQLPFQCVA